AGSPNPRLLDKLRLVPTLIVVTGVQLLLLGGAGLFLPRCRSLALAKRIPRLPSSQLGLWFLCAGWAAMAILSLNFGAISLVDRLRKTQNRTDAQVIAAEFGEDYRVVRAVRETTPESAAILIKTQRPLQYLLNYELYPRRFYFYPDRQLPVSSIPEEWINRRRIGWTLEISDEEPLHFELLPRKVAF
ncbi:MAG: hypothetical protein L0312_09980, partial [Acidobacteria bacterium]|nr:hypothetical protein [Acidobacteriota bacterium]